jgi:phenylacetate-CoA ligase
LRRSAGPRHSGPGLASWRDKRAAFLVRYAARHVPYYRELFRDHGLDPESFHSIDDLQRIPVTNKADLKERPIEELISDEYDPANLKSYSTSGSSGIPMKILRSWFDDRCLNLFWMKHLPSQGVRPRDRIATLSAVRGPSAERILIQRALNALGLFRNTKISNLLPVAEILKTLEACRPHRLMGYPGALLRIGEAHRNSRVSNFAPDSVHTFGEVLTPDLRERLSACFNAPVYDIYGSYEFGMAAFECGQSGVYHVGDESVHLEVLKDGVPVGEGENGVLVGTNLLVTAMPFIRFNIGDLVTRGPARCPCGESTSTITNLRGRMLDMFPLPDGREIHPYEITLKLLAARLSSVSQYQLTQETAHSIVLTIVPASPDIQPSHFQAYRDQIASFLGPEINFEIRLVDHIDFEKSGKFRVSRSKVKSNYDEVNAIG